MQIFEESDRLINPESKGVFQVLYSKKQFIADNIYCQCLSILEHLVYYLVDINTPIHIVADINVIDLINKMFGGRLNLVDDIGESQIYINTSHSEYIEQKVPNCLQLIDLTSDISVLIPGESYFLYPPFGEPFSGQCYVVVLRSTDEYTKHNLNDKLAKVYYQDIKIRGEQGKRWLNPVDYTDKRNTYDECSRDKIIYGYLHKFGKDLINRDDIIRVDNFIIDRLKIDLSPIDYTKKDRPKETQINIPDKKEMRRFLINLAKLYEKPRETLSIILTKIESLDPTKVDIAQEIKSLIDGRKISYDIYYQKEIKKLDIFDEIGDEIRSNLNNCESECDWNVIYYPTEDSLKKFLLTAREKLRIGGYLSIICPDEINISVELIGYLINGTDEIPLSSGDIIDKVRGYKDLYGIIEKPMKNIFAHERLLICCKTI